MKTCKTKLLEMILVFTLPATHQDFIGPTTLLIDFPFKVCEPPKRRRNHLTANTYTSLCIINYISSGCNPYISTHTLMAASIRATSTILFRSKHSSASVSRIHRRNGFAGIRTLHVPGTQLYKRKGEGACLIGTSSTVSSFKFRTMVTSSSEENLSNEDFRELEKWRRGGGLFHTSADIDGTAFIESGAIVHAHAKIGPKVHLGSGTVVGPYVSIGSSTRIGYNVSLQNCSVGDFCIIHNGVCIGQDGFGHFVDEQGNMVKKPQLLYAKIGNHVEMGANTCIDRGSWRDTVIGDYTRIDNLVQIGHNALIGHCCILCGQVGIAGSVTMGDYVVMGGKSSVADHVSIASKVPAQNWRRSVITLRRLSQRDDSG